MSEKANPFLDSLIKTNSKKIDMDMGAVANGALYVRSDETLWKIAE